jgi:3-oxoacyl-(acyl-carrier-protein) synthase
MSYSTKTFIVLFEYVQLRINSTKSMIGHLLGASWTFDITNNFWPIP